MTKTRNLMTILTVFIVFIMVIPFSGCKKDETPAPTPARTSTYKLLVTDVPGITGKATFTETSSTVTTIDIMLKTPFYKI